MLFCGQKGVELTERSPMWCLIQFDDEVKSY